MPKESIEPVCIAVITREEAIADNLHRQLSLWAEATDADNQMFSTDRTLAALNEAMDAPPRELLENVRRAVDGFVKDVEQFDDLTMLCIEHRGPAKEDGDPL